MSKNGSQGANYAISQNFLTSRATIQRCLSLARLGPQDTVLEIGTGKGHITRALACRCKRVLTYEIDPDLCRTLEGKLPGNVRLVRGGFSPRSPAQRALQGLCQHPLLPDQRHRQ